MQKVASTSREWDRAERRSADRHHRKAASESAQVPASYRARDRAALGLRYSDGVGRAFITGLERRVATGRGDAKPRRRLLHSARSGAQGDAMVAAQQAGGPNKNRQDRRTRAERNGRRATRSKSGRRRAGLHLRISDNYARFSAHV